jgi:hypothetical protein
VTSVQPHVESRYSWNVTTVTDAATGSIRVPVASQVGWPQVSYTVTYSRTRAPEMVYVLSGSLVITNREALAAAINLPDITVTTAAGTQYRMPEAALQCPSLVVPAVGSLNCSFAAGYASRQPLPGTVSAVVSLAGTLLPMQLEAAPVAYDFAGAEEVQVGVFATASNYFEMGPGIIQPYGVYGEQPPPGLRLEDSRVFRFIAVFGGLTASSCGQQAWKVSVWRGQGGGGHMQLGAWLWRW